MALPRLTDGFWASILQWTRLGSNALVLLVVTRFLTLEQVGAFATAVAPLRFFQVIHKSGIEESVILRARDPAMLDALFAISMTAALAITAVCGGGALAVGLYSPSDSGIGAMLAVLSLGSVAFGLGAVPDGILRRNGKFRLLALRSLAAQTIAVVATMAALFAGAGPWALVVFTLANAFLSAAISVVMAGWQPTWQSPGRANLVVAMQGTFTLSSRVLIGAALQPILQIGVGAAAGLAAAGVFQIALRVLALIEAVTLAPLRFIALPRFSRLQHDAAALAGAIHTTLRQAGVVSAWVYLGVAAAAPDLLTVLVGQANGAETVVALRVLCLGGLGMAGAAVINQALIGTGRGTAALRIALLQAALTLALAAPALGILPAVTAVFPVTATLIFSVMLWRLPNWFGLSASTALHAVGLPYLAGGVMALAVIGLNASLWPDWPLLLRLPCQIVVGTGIYLMAMRIVAPQKTAARFWRWTSA